MPTLRCALQVRTASGFLNTIVAGPRSPAIGFHALAALGCSVVVRGTERRRGIIRQLILRVVGAFHFQFVEQHRRTYDRGEGNGGPVADQRVVPGGREIAAQSTRIEFIENRAPDHFFVAIFCPDAVEHPRREAWPKNLYQIPIGTAPTPPLFYH